MIYFKLLPILSLGFYSVLLGALGEQDFPIIIRIENPQAYKLYLSDAKGKKVEVDPGTSYEWLVKNGQNWQAQYASGKFGTIAWNFDQSLVSELDKCSNEFKRKVPNDDSLYICTLEFARDPSRSGPLVGSSYIFNIKNVDALGIKRHEFNNIFTDFYNQLFPSDKILDAIALEKFIGNLKPESKNSSNLLEKFVQSISKVASANKQKGKSTQHVLVFGDQGTGNQNAKNVARDMYATCNLKRCDFAISAGDNAYPHGPSINDADWQRALTDKFVNIYKPLWDRFAFPFYTTLGNHDIGIEDFFFGDWVYSWQTKYDEKHFIDKRIPLMKAQIMFTSDDANPKKASLRMWNMENEHYSKLIEKNGIKTFIVSLDTNYFPGQLLPNKTPYNKEQSAWLLKELQSDAAKKADWRIVFAHHPIYSAGRHGVNVGKLIGKNDHQAMLELRKELQDIFCANDVDFYLVGHDHHLELDLIPCTTGRVAVQVLSGAASKADVAKWHEMSISEKLAGPDAFSATLIKESPNFLWANGLSREDIIKGQSLPKMYGFSFLELHSDHAVLEMIESTPTGPRWLDCWRFDKAPEGLLKKSAIRTGCQENLSDIFEEDVHSALPKK